MELKLDRKFLSALGIDGDKADQICDANSATVNRVKAELDDAKEKLEAANNALKKVTKERDTLKDAMPDEPGKNPYKVKYDALKEEFEAFKENTEKEAQNRAKTAAVRSLLKDIGINEKRLESVLRVTSLDDIELDEKGQITNASELKKSMKTEWADFITSEQQHGVEPANPPANTGGKKYADKAEIFKIKDPAERQKAIMDNHELFGI